MGMLYFWSHSCQHLILMGRSKMKTPSNYCHHHHHTIPQGHVWICVQVLCILPPSPAPIESPCCHCIHHSVGMIMTYPPREWRYAVMNTTRAAVDWQHYDQIKISTGLLGYNPRSAIVVVLCPNHPIVDFCHQFVNHCCRWGTIHSVAEVTTWSFLYLWFFYT